MSRPPSPASRRPLLTVVARRSRLRPTRRHVATSVTRSLGKTVGAALLAAPLALIWGIGHAEIDDYLGPHHVHFASNYRGEVQIDLGPFGNAYLPSPRAPIGLKITVGGVGAVADTQASFLSPATLAAYAGIFAEPEEAVAGVVDRLSEDVLVESLLAELALLSVFAAWVARRQLLAPSLVGSISSRRAAVVYVSVLAAVLGTVLAPPRAAPGLRQPVSIAAGTAFSGLTVDSLLLADGLDRGVKGISVLTRRQQQAVRSYIATASANLAAQSDRLPQPAAGETLLFGFSDLHCSRAMTELLRRLVLRTKPAQVLSSGDDTVSGTAAERSCITREAKMANGLPFTVATGNHDSDVTESQLRQAKAQVLDGSVVHSAGLAIVGDDDPERNLPFSMERVQDRPESEEQLGRRLVDVARGKRVDVLLVHQPAASVVVMTTPDPPARLVLYGHYHIQSGPSVVKHSDGSWTVGMQEGTAGGVREPTFTSFSTPFSPPLISADAYFYFRDVATGLVTGVQPVHFLPDARVVVSTRIRTGDLSKLPPETRQRLAGDAATPSSTPQR